MNTILFIFLYIFVFATGAAGLIYEVTWQKYLSRLFGSDAMATAIILAVFLGGLSLGYYLCGKLTTKVKNQFKAYALLEAIIGLWALFFPKIFALIDTLTKSWSFSPPFFMLIQGVICAGLLTGIPTICMGGTIPFLTRGISRNITEATHVHARVYAINTAGAFLGTLLAGFYLIPYRGLPLTMMETAILNLGAATFFYLMSVSKKDTQPFESLTDINEAKSAALRFPAYMLYIIAFLSGFYVMSLENVLIRITNLSLGSSSYSFSMIVAVFVLSIAIGSYVVGRLKRLPKHLLFINQSGITIFLLLLYLSLDKWPYYAHLVRISFQSNIVGFWGYYCAVFLSMILLLVMPVSLMGATVPLAFHELKQDLKNVGRHSGLLFSWNTMGNLTGSLIGGMVFYYLFNNNHIFLMAIFLAAISSFLASWPLSKNIGCLP